MRFYRLVAFVLAISFAGVGLLFLLAPDAVLRFFGLLSGPLGLQPAPEVGFQFYLALASGYMYLVALLAWLMFRHPENRSYSGLLINAKLATSLLSLGFFIFHRPYLVYLANFMVDGLIGLGVLAFRQKWQKAPR